MFAMTDSIFDIKGLLLDQRCCNMPHVCDSDQMRAEPQLLVLIMLLLAAAAAAATATTTTTTTTTDLSLLGLVLVILGKQMGQDVATAAGDVNKRSFFTKTQSS